MSNNADSVESQDLPPYGSPSGVLILPAVELLAEHLRPGAFLPPPALRAAFPIASLQLTPFQDRSSPYISALASPSVPPRHYPTQESPRPRSNTIGGTKRLRARHRPAYPTTMSAPSSSPPPYSLTPPEVQPVNATTSTRRAASSPHLRLPGSPPPISPLSSHTRQAFSDYARARAYPNPTSDEDESGADTDDGVMFRPSFTDTLRHRLLGKGKARAFDEHLRRPITTARSAGETETESEDSPRNLPTARITPSSLSRQLRLPPSTAWIVPVLFQLFRLLAIVPAVFGTLWNLYHVFRPPDGRTEWRVDFIVSVLWSILTGWQCLQLTTGLLKRWRVYYSPFATLIRLLALQAICWPATHLTLTILNHEVRPLICWAAIGTTTCCSRSIQLWVTSNIIPTPYPPGAPTQEEELLRKGPRRRWDWAQVGIKCALPAGVVYFVMAWAVVLRREFTGC